MKSRRIHPGVLAGLIALAVTGSTLMRLDHPLAAQSGEQQLPPFEQRLSAWAQAKGSERIPTAVSFGKRLPDAQLEQLARRYDLQPYAVFMWQEGMSGVHRVDPSKASVTVITEARRTTIGMKEKAKESNRFRSQRFIHETPQEKIAGDQDLQHRAKFLLKSAEQNDKILSAVRGGAPLIFGMEVLGSPEQIRKLAADPLVSSVEPAVLSQGKLAVPPVVRPAETKGRYQSAEIENLTAAAAYNRLARSAGVDVKGVTR